MKHFFTILTLIVFSVSYVSANADPPVYEKIGICEISQEAIDIQVLETFGYFKTADFLIVGILGDFNCYQELIFIEKYKKVVAGAENKIYKSVIWLKLKDYPILCYSNCSKIVQTKLLTRTLNKDYSQLGYSMRSVTSQRI